MSCGDRGGDLYPGSTPASFWVHAPSGNVCFYWTFSQLGTQLPLPVGERVAEQAQDFYFPVTLRVNFSSAASCALIMSVAV